MKKILIIDDSAFMRRVLSDIINSTRGYEVAYTASHGGEGLRIIAQHDDIDVIFCDINMPLMNGLDFLRNVKQQGIEIPVIMISSCSEAQDTMEALDLGAFEFVPKPQSRTDEENKLYVENIVNAMTTAATYKDEQPTARLAARTVIKQPVVQPVGKMPTAEPPRRSQKDTGSKKLVAIVCSTGGPKALQHVLPKIKAGINAPVLVVQHMPVGFTATMASRLDSLSMMKVKEAADGEKIKKGVAYIAKGGTHLTLKKNNGDYTIKFDDRPAVVGLKPCGNLMYDSLVDSDFDEIICVVMTGMGADGTKGIKALSKHKKLYVIAQDEASSTVYGMPKAIYESGLTDCVCDLDEIANEIMKKVGA